MSAADQLREQLQAAQTRCDRLTQVRRNLPPKWSRYSTTARRTNAQSRWARACEVRDGLLLELELEAGREAFDRPGPCELAIEVSREKFDELLAIAEEQRGR